MNVLVFTSLWPNGEQPNFGVFVKHRALAVARLDGLRLRVVAPVPYFPRSLDASFVPEHWRIKARIKDHEELDGLSVEHPRYLATPKVGQRYYGRWMSQSAADIVQRLHAEQPFDLIDAHYIYPDGWAALQLGKKLKLPVVMTARGSDVNEFPELPAIRPLVIEALAGATKLIAVSGGLKDNIVKLGVPESKTVVIRNGIDRAIFYPRDRVSARQRLGLDPEKKIAIAVGALIPRKRTEALIDAWALMRERGADQGALLYVLGEGPERPMLEARIAAHGLQERVFLPGAKLQKELPEWSAAADLFCHAARAEGCPNAVVEALGCGIPVVVTDIPGSDELITSSKYGHLIPSDGTTAEAFADKVAESFNTAWDRDAIARDGAARGWDEVAAEVKNVFVEALALHHPPRQYALQSEARKSA